MPLPEAVKMQALGKKKPPISTKKQTAVENFIFMWYNLNHQKDNFEFVKVLE
ncbi:hypothetical protein [Longicatena caecimuris]|uniref:hypothetical protein n=1 Tax=Longicatena caecimuris TaxID=1796635 RepID=UPI0022E3C928|nr:hypothetical protein [Longicatena caecimuris]